MKKGDTKLLQLIQNVLIKETVPGIYIEGKRDYPAIIMAHGIMGSKNEYLNTLAHIAEVLEKRHIASLRIDFAGHGDSKQSLDNFSLSSQVENLNDAISWMEGMGYGKFILLGVSFGAPPCIISTLLNKTVKKTVLIAPVMDYKKTFMNPITSWGKEKFGLEKILDGIRTNGLYLDEEYYLSPAVLQDILLVDIPTFLGIVDKKIIIFHGDTDDMVPYSVSARVTEENTNIELVTMINTEHGITEVGDEDFSRSITRNNLNLVVEYLREE